MSREEQYEKRLGAANHVGPLSGATIRDTLIGVLRPLLKKRKHPIRRLSPQRPTAYFSSKGKGRTQKKPDVRPIHIPLEQVANLRLARGSLSGPLANLRLARG